MKRKSTIKIELQTSSSTCSVGLIEAIGQKLIKLRQVGRIISPIKKSTVTKTNYNLLQLFLTNIHLSLSICQYSLPSSTLSPSVCLSLSLSLSVSACLGVSPCVCLFLFVCVSPCLSLCLALCVCLSLCPSLSLRVSVSLCPSPCVRLSLSLCLSVCLSVCESISLCVCLSPYLSVYLSVSVSISLCICLCVHLSVCLSLCLTLSLSLSLCVSLSVSLKLCVSVPESPRIRRSLQQYVNKHFLGQAQQHKAIICGDAVELQRARVKVLRQLSGYKSPTIYECFRPRKLIKL